MKAVRCGPKKEAIRQAVQDSCGKIVLSEEMGVVDPLKRWTSRIRHSDVGARVRARGSQFGLNLSYAVQPSPDGLAQVFIIGEDFIDGDSCALVLGGNIFFGNGFGGHLRRAVEQEETQGGATVFAIMWTIRSDLEQLSSTNLVVCRLLV